MTYVTLNVIQIFLDANILKNVRNSIGETQCSVNIILVVFIKIIVRVRGYTTPLGGEA